MQGLGRKAALGRHRRRSEDNIKVDLKEIGLDFMDWIQLTQDKGKWWAAVNRVKCGECSQ
jgi:hypothetical protein